MANKEALYLGAKVYFVREASGVSDANNKPLDFSSGEIGIADRIRVRLDHQRREIIKPYPGRRRLVDIISIGMIERIEITMRNITPIFWELMTGSGELDEGTDVAYTAGATTGEVKGWLKLEYHDANDATKYEADRWCSIRIEEVPIEDQEIQYVIHADVLYSSLNGGTIVEV